MQLKKSCGSDHLSRPCFLKQIGEQASLPTAILINKSLSDGIVPDELKIAKIVPVYKSKAKNEFCNYRPISLLPSISKILGRVVYKRTYAF